MCNQNHAFLQRQEFRYKYKPQSKNFPIFLAKVAPKSVWQSEKVAPKNVNMLIYSDLKNNKKSNIFF